MFFVFVIIGFFKLIWSFVVTPIRILAIVFGSSGLNLGGRLFVLILGIVGIACLFIAPPISWIGSLICWFAIKIAQD